MSGDPSFLAKPQHTENCYLNIIFCLLCVCLLELGKYWKLKQALSICIVELFRELRLSHLNLQSLERGTNNQSFFSVLFSKFFCNDIGFIFYVSFLKSLKWLLQLLYPKSWGFYAEFQPHGLHKTKSCFLFLWIYTYVNFWIGFPFTRKIFVNFEILITKAWIIDQKRWNLVMIL